MINLIIIVKKKFIREFYKDTIKKFVIIILKNISDFVISINTKHYKKKKKFFI